MHDQVTSLTWLHVRFIFIHLFYPYLYLFLAGHSYPFAASDLALTDLLIVTKDCLVITG